MEQVTTLVRKLILIICPTLALASVWPMVKELPPIMITANLNIFQVFLVIPWYLGIMCAPGYVYVVFADKNINQLISPYNSLIKMNLVLAVISSIGGLMAILAIQPAPYVLSSLFCSIYVMKKYMKNK